MQCLMVSLFVVCGGKFVCSVWWRVCVLCLMVSLCAMSGGEFVCSI